MIADARGYGKRFIVRADQLLTAFLELERRFGLAGTALTVLVAAMWLRLYCACLKRH